MKRVLLVSPYFVPSNLAGVQRVRLLSSSLERFGWEPIVLAVDPQCYEEAIDPSSSFLLSDRLCIEKVHAWPASICRRLGIGDLSLRGHIALRRGIHRIVNTMRPDAIFVTVLPGYASLLGSWAKKRFGLPFVLDYQDPWVSRWGAAQPKWSKAGIAHRLAERLEPKVLPHTDGITAVSDETLDTLRERRLLPTHVPVEIIPIGADQRDHDVAARHGRSFITRQEGVFHVAYLGTITDRMVPALKAVLRGVAIAQKQSGRALRLHLIGTSGQPCGRDQYAIATLVAEAALTESVALLPSRVGYLDALRTMQDADALVMIGSTDSHYTASKLFPYWLSGKPILGVFHRRSTINELCQRVGGARLVSYGDEEAPETKAREVAHEITELMRGKPAQPRDPVAFHSYTAEGVASRFASIFDRVGMHNNMQDTLRPETGQCKATAI